MTTAADRSAKREELHFRRLDMRGFRRTDGLYEVEGRLVDRKPGDFVPVSGGKLVPAGNPVHDLGVRLVFDDMMVVHAVETFSDAYPYEQCPEGGQALQQLVGLSMTKGWSSEVRSRLGGAHACAHLRDMLMPLATVAVQSLSEMRRTQPDKLDASGRPLKIDSCYAYGAERQLVERLWPQFHIQPKVQRDNNG